MSAFKTFSTHCPNCKSEGTLHVIEVTFSFVEHLPIELNVPLEADGFDMYTSIPVELRHIKDLSTEDERVRCSACGAQYDLDQLLIRT